MRQTLTHENDPTPGVSISTLAHEYPRASLVPGHAHGSSQLIYAGRGVMEVSSGRRLWTIPPHFALWIPAKTTHQIRMPEAVSMRTLYLRSRLIDLGRSCTVLYVGGLLRELIFEVVRIGRLRNRSHLESALRDVLLAQLKQASPVPTGVALPTDDRAFAVAQTVIADPGARLSLVSMCGSAGLSVRTLERVFHREVGIDFESWRRQVRLMKAVELMISGASIKQAAFSVGYHQPTAFVELFRRTYATTPKAWVSALKRL
ncbi:MAG TPA: helix-turn-helix transcriptional regulator [Blastocatellia bacterium]